MLSRTADHLYWMARYTERAENTARMLDVNYQMSLMPQSDKTTERAWRAMLEISELTHAYGARHTGVTASEVIQFMVSDMDNLSSIMRCLLGARENARGTRIDHDRALGNDQHHLARSATDDGRRRARQRAGGLL